MAVSVDLRWAIWERDNFTCRECGSRRRLSVDHVNPAGGDEETNLQTLCVPCNSSKQRRLYGEQRKMRLRYPNNPLTKEQLDTGRDRAHEAERERGRKRASQIKELLQSGLTQSQAARLLGVTRQAIYHMVKRYGLNDA